MATRRVLLLSCYELGQQPQHLAGAAAFLTVRGHELRACDLAVEALDDSSIAWAEVVCVAVPMHTAFRLARSVLERVRAARGDSVILVVYGLYAPMAAEVLPAGMVDHAVGGEFEEELCRIAGGARVSRSIVLDRQLFPTPRRDLLPPLDTYARLVRGDVELTAGRIEASRGCVHRCRHCPVPVVYDGRIRIVQAETVVADAVQQWRMGARHLSLGDPDFLNAVPHALTTLRAVRAQLPEVTFDITTKVEHIVRHASVFDELRALGVIFVVSAVESTSDTVLRILDKGHTHADTLQALRVVRGAGIELRPSLLPFTPWTTLRDHLALLDFVAAEELFESVDPVHLSIRLLLPAGSLLLDRPETRPQLRARIAGAGEIEWVHPDPLMDALAADSSALVAEAADGGEDSLLTHLRLRRLVAEAAAASGIGWDPGATVPPRRSLPRLSEPWFCCAEPTPAQRAGVLPLSMAGG